MDDKYQEGYEAGYAHGRRDAAQELTSKMTEFSMMDGFAQALINTVKGKINVAR